MPRYGDDRCEECGAARVSGSRLCVGCLVKESDILEKEVLIKMVVIEGQGWRIKNLEALLKETTVYGFKQNQKAVKLQYHIEVLERKLKREVDDGKDRQDGNI